MDSTAQLPAITSKPVVPFCPCFTLTSQLPQASSYSVHSFLSRHVQVLMISFMTSALSQLGINMNSQNAALLKFQHLLKKKTKKKPVYCSQTPAGRTDSTELKYSQNFLGFFSWVERSRGSSRHCHLHSRLTNRNRLEILHTNPLSFPSNAELQRNFAFL